AAGAADSAGGRGPEPRVARLRAAAEARRAAAAEAEETRLTLARAQLREALPGRSPRWQETLASLARGAARGRPRAALPGRAPRWKETLASLERAAAFGTSVLLTGETGTEKDAAALAL